MFLTTTTKWKNRTWFRKTQILVRVWQFTVQVRPNPLSNKVRPNPLSNKVEGLRTFTDLETVVKCCYGDGTSLENSRLNHCETEDWWRNVQLWGAARLVELRRINRPKTQTTTFRDLEVETELQRWGFGVRTTRGTQGENLSLDPLEEVRRNQETPVYKRPPIQYESLKRSARNTESNFWPDKKTWFTLFLAPLDHSRDYEILALVQIDHWKHSCVQSL